jgi:hypothetical protein
MKRIIRFLANISGVEYDIRLSERKNVGGSMNQAKYWWTGGADGASNYPLLNGFHLYAKGLLEGKYHPDMSIIRKEVYKCGKKIHPDFN